MLTRAARLGFIRVNWLVVVGKEDGRGKCLLTMAARLGFIRVTWPKPGWLNPHPPPRAGDSMGVVGTGGDKGGKGGVWWEGGGRGGGWC